MADELARSAQRLIHFAPPVPERHHQVPAPKQIDKTEEFAFHVLRLIANRKLCRHIIGSAPGTAIAIFEEAIEAKKFHLPLGAFATNVSAEAICNTDSILYHEGDDFTSGLLGSVKLFSRTLYGNFYLVEGLARDFGSPLDIDYFERDKWSPEMLEMYCRVTLLTLDDYLVKTRQPHSYALSRAFHDIEGAVSGVHKLNEAGDDFYQLEAYRRFSVIVNFVVNAIDAVSNAKHPPYQDKLRLHKDEFGESIYDQLARLMFEVVLAASSVARPVWTAWTVQHNDAWSSFMPMSKTSSTWKIVQFKLRRLLYNELLAMPNFKGARVLGYCLNVMGLTVGKGTYGRMYRPLVKAVHAWTKKHYLDLRKQYPSVAEAALIGSLSYDSRRNCVVKTYRERFDGTSPAQYLQLDGDADEVFTATQIRKVTSRRRAGGRRQT